MKTTSKPIKVNPIDKNSVAFAILQLAALEQSLRQIKDSGAENAVQVTSEISSVVKNSEVSILQMMNRILLEIRGMAEALTSLATTLSVMDRKGPKGDPGDPGQGYILTEKDLETIARKIPQAPVEKIIERTEIIKEVSDTPDQLVEKLSKATKKLPESLIEGLNDIRRMAAFNPTMGPSFSDLKRLENLINTTSSSTGAFTKLTYSDIIDGDNQDFTFDAAPVFAVVDQNRIITEGDGYSVVGTTATFDIAPTFSLVAFG